jgi:hypothetical protein
MWVHTTGELQKKTRRPGIIEEHPVYWHRTEDVQSLSQKGRIFFNLRFVHPSYIASFFSLVFHIFIHLLFFFSFFLNFLIFSLWTIQQVVYSTSFLHYSQIFYSSSISGKTTIHNNWTISLYNRVLFPCNPLLLPTFLPPYLPIFLTPYFLSHPISLTKF